MKPTNPDPDPSAAAPAAASSSPTTVPRGSRSKIWLRRTGLTLTGLASITALFYAVENWRGARAWAAALNQVKARADQTSQAALNQLPIPDDRNMVLHPAFRCYTLTRADGTRARRTKKDQPDPQDAEMAARWEALIKADFRANGQLGPFYDPDKFTPPSSEAIRNTIQQLSIALAPHEPLLSSIREACQRPSAGWPRPAGRETTADGNPHETSTVYFLTILQQGARALAAHSLFKAADGKMEEAWQDLQCFAQLQVLIKSYGLELISALGAASLSGIQEAAVIRLLECSPAIQPGAAAFEIHLASSPPVTDLLREGAEGEAAWRLSLLIWFFGHTDRWETSQFFVSAEEWKYRLMPWGWLQQNAAATVLLDQDICEILRSPGTPANRLSALEPLLAQAADGAKSNPYRWMPGVTADVFKGMGYSFLRVEARRGLLRTALLAAQQRAATGKTPQSLDDLSNDFKVRVPRSPIHDDLPVISRDAQGVWTISCQGWGESPSADENPALKIRGW